jgi:DNA-binding response OmpR family regulator
MTRGNSKKRILVIDDEENLLRIVGDRLQFAGYDVYTAHNGTEGLKKAGLTNPHLILLDIMMPDIDGFNVLLQLKKNRKTRSSAVMMLTSKNEDDAIDRAINMGAVDYIVKPFTVNVLLDKISRAISRK